MLDQHVKPYKMYYAMTLISHCENVIGFNEEQIYLKQPSFV
jgi:hypothetical protein